ncbi:MAG: Na+ dependent nucleoside transporter [Caulobacteraceae bacterium]|nr:Na+ dependent nucleoside transporter [Caulobacteraceae bacterium]
MFGFGWENAQSLIGVALVMLVCWAWSEARERFPWRLAIGSILVQLALVLVLFGLPAARAVVQLLNRGVDGLASATQQGVQFVFGFLGGGAQPYPVANPGALFVFAFDVLPLIIVISALSALLWHWQILKWIVRGFGLVFQKTLGMGGASALSAAVNIFLGNVECALIIKGYLEKLTRSELFLMMVLGLATVAGSTMIAYATILRMTIPDAAAHVITASILSAPAGILLARIMVPEEPGKGGEDAEYDSLLKYDSAIDAIGVGISDGLAIALNIGATLIVFVSLVAIANGLLSVLPPLGGGPVSVQRILGVLFAPLAWTIGIPWKEAAAAGNLLGVKLVLTEIVAFIDLAKTPELSERSRIIMTYAICGFANIGSVGIVVSGFGVLMPSRRKEVIGLVWKALLAGFLATCMTGALVGALPRSLFGL